MIWTKFTFRLLECSVFFTFCSGVIVAVVINSLVPQISVFWAGMAFFLALLSIHCTIIAAAHAIIQAIKERSQ